MEVIKSAIFKYVGNDTKDFVIATQLPVSRNSTLSFVFNVKDGFQCEIPVIIKYKDDFGREKVFHENYAKFVQDNYGENARNPEMRVLKFVKYVKEELIAHAPLGEELEPEPTPDAEVTDTQKGKKREKQNA